MAANPEGPFELAMTHLPSSEGRQVSYRPAQVRAIAARIQGWKDAPDTCQSCSAAPARWLRQGMALCPSCRDNRATREGGIEYLDRRLREQRADPVIGDGLAGYAIVFDEWSVDLGGFKERIRPEAMNRTIEEQIDLRALWNHNTDVTLGRMTANTMRGRKDVTGYHVRVVTPSWAAPQFETVDRRDVQGQSFGFRTIDDEWNFDGPIPLRDVLDMRVSETSFVSFPAYPQTTARAERDLRITRSEEREYLERCHKLRLAR